MKKEELCGLLREWEKWANSCSREVDGWESYFPGFSRLVQLACELMVDCSALEPTTYAVVEKVWLISEEDEAMIDFCKSCPSDLFEWLSCLSESQFETVRWQAAEAFTSLGKRASPDLRNLASDQDPYVRRRAVLALQEIADPRVAEFVRSLLNDSDDYNRYVADLIMKEMDVQSQED